MKNELIKLIDDRIEHHKKYDMMKRELSELDWVKAQIEELSKDEPNFPAKCEPCNGTGRIPKPKEVE